MKKYLQLAAALLALSLAAVAQDSGSRVFRGNRSGEWIEETTGNLSATRTVKIKTSAGAIRITGGQQSNITYAVRKHVRADSEESARREFARLRFTTGIVGDTAVLRGECEGYRGGAVEFDVHVPNQTALIHAETSGGVIAANSVSGRVEAATGGGSIQMDHIGQGVYASSGGGSIDLGTIGGDVRVETGGGSIKVSSAGGQVIASSGGGTLSIGGGKDMNLETGGGSIYVDKCTGAMKASTGGGSIDVNQVDGHALVESGGGSIKVGPVKGGVRAETGSGPIVADLATGGTPFTDSRLETSAGNIIVYLPDNLGVTIRAAVEVANGQGIISDFPGLKITYANDHYGPREAYAEGALNGGGPILHVHTTTGSIEFRHKNK
jgi:DUF4097 and DUF4098 domain-containing protein YvlB